jgi:restriction system protein
MPTTSAVEAASYGAVMEILEYAGLAPSWATAAAGLLLLLALSVGVRKHRRQRARARPATPGSAAVAALSWRDFELLTGEFFRRRGYAIVESQRGADGGVDLKLGKEGHTVIVHCKRWLMRDISVKVVQELHNIVRMKGGTSGIVVASGTFTPDARRFAEQVRIELVDGAALARTIDTDSAGRRDGRV